MKIIALACVVGLLALPAHADPVDNGVWVHARISTGASTPPGSPGQQLTNESFTAGTSNGIDNAFDDEGLPLDTNRDFYTQSTGSLATGTLAFYSEGQGGPAGNFGNSVLSSRALLVDTLTFGATGGFVPFSASIDGDLDSTFPLQFGFNELKIVVAPGNFAFNGVTSFASVGALFTALDAVELADVTQAFILTPGFNDNGISGGFNAAPNTSYRVFLFGSLITASNETNNMWTADFSNTASFSFDLTGLDVTSASGVFPGTTTPGPGPVPEPGVVLLTLAGAAVAWRRRRP